MPDALRELTGWGRTAPSAATVVAPRAPEDLPGLLARAEHGTIARGLGRSYGDAAQLAGGTVVDMRHLDAVGDVDARSGEVSVEAGVSLDALVRRTLPSGWFLPVTPGTRQVTVGGAIAADVHGKNHHVDGTFGAHVTELTLVTPTGTHRVSPATDPELFWATAGGMGLTGVVARARVRLLRVETDAVLVDTERFSDLDGVMAAMAAGDQHYRYSVAWVDCTGGPGRRGLGRAVLTRANHAGRDDLPAGERSRAPAPPPSRTLGAPRRVPAGLLNRYSIAAFNEAWFRRAPRRREGERQSLWQFFHPLDGVADWNRLYGPRGFVQYQFCVPADRGDVVREAMMRLSGAHIPSFLAVLKRFGPASPGPLSFPAEGWTLALDLPVGPVELGCALDRLDEIVTDAGGRVYLAKDARVRPDLVPQMYPRLDELCAVRARVDPQGTVRSDLARRLGIC